MPHEPLQKWAPRVSKALDRVPQTVHGRTKTWARGLKRRLRAKAPKRTGDLAKSIDVEVERPKGRDLGGVTVSSDDPALKLIEEGGTQHGDPFLAVPVRPGIGAASPREDMKLFAIQTRDGRVFLASDAGGRLDVRWKLVRRIHRRAQPFAEPEIRRAAKRFGREVLNDLTASVLR